MSREFVILSAKEFDDFAKNSPLAHFQQTSKWGELKKNNGWQPYFVGVKNNQKIEAAALLLKKPLPLGLSIFYSPRGPLLDYNNQSLLEFFTKNLQKFAKSHHAIFIKIDPEVIHIERDSNGEIVKNGLNNSKIVQNLQKLGYRHHGFNLEGNLAPQYVYTLNLTGATPDALFENFNSTHKSRLRQNDKNGVMVRQMNYDELPIFSKIMASTAERRQFTDRPLSYYQAMYKNLGKDIVFYLAYVDLNLYQKNLQTELAPLKAKHKDLENALKSTSHPEKIQNQLKNLENTISGLQNRLEKAKNYAKSDAADKNGILNLGALMFVESNREIISLFGGAYGEFREFNAAYSLNWEMIKYAVENGYQKYNFYGISEFKDKTSPFYGLYEFKKGFGGQIEEYIGEFDLVISKFWYFCYRLAFELPKNLRRIKNNKKFASKN